MKYCKGYLLLLSLNVLFCCFYYSIVSTLSLSFLEPSAGDLSHNKVKSVLNTSGKCNLERGGECISVGGGDAVPQKSNREGGGATFTLIHIII